MSKNLELLHAHRLREGSQHALVLPRPVHSRRAGEGRARWEDPQLLLPALRVLARHWPWVLGVAVLVPALVGAVVFSMAPVYEPSARIELNSGQQLFLPPGGEARLSTAQYAETQTQNLQSGELQLEVIQKLGLDKNKEWLGTAFTGSAASAHVPSNGGALSAAEYRALELFGRSIRVNRDNSSWLISVSFAARDPKLAALVTNTVVETFVERDYRNRADAVRESTKWLSQQLDDIRQRMNDSNQALADFQKTSGITAVGESRSSFDERVAELNRQLTLARVDRIQLEALLSADKRNAYSLAQVSADPNVQEISKKLGALRAEKKQTLVIYGENHPKARQLQAEIDELQSEFALQEQRVLANLNNSFRAAHTREKLLDAELENATKQIGLVEQYDSLRKESHANEELYKSLFAKVKETAILGGAAPSNIRWVDHAQVLDQPTRPRRKLDMAAGMVAGIFGGILLAFIRESVNTRLRSVDDVRSWIETANVSLVPLVCQRALNFKPKHDKHISRQPFVLERPNSPEGEALRGLVTSVAPWHQGSAPRVLLVASSHAGEGKSTIAANLAIALARTGKTCLVDADLRNPVLASIFRVRHERGLAALLSGDCDLEHALVALDEVPNLTLLPGGSTDARSSEFLTSQKFRSLLETLRDRFQYVIVDSSPLLPYADARVIAPLGEGIVLVARAGATTGEALQRSLEILHSVHAAPVLDVVLNAVPHRSLGYGYNYRYAS